MNRQQNLKFQGSRFQGHWVIFGKGYQHHIVLKNVLKNWKLGTNVCPAGNLKPDHNTHNFHPHISWHRWCDQAKWVWSRSNSIFIFIWHFQSYLLQQTLLKLVNSSKDTGSWKVVKQQETKIICFVWLYILKSVFVSSDSSCLVTSQLYTWLIPTLLPSLAWQLTLSGVSNDINFSSLPPLDASSSSSFLYSPVRTTLAGGSAKSSGVLPSVLRMFGSAPCWRSTVRSNMVI